MPRSGQSNSNSSESSSSSSQEEKPGIYYQIEDKYYDFCDWLNAKKVPIYQFFVQPIESKGVPSFPFALLISLFILFALVFAISSSGLLAGFTFPSLANNSATLQVSVQSSGSPVSGATVNLLQNGQVFQSVQTGQDGSAVFSNLPSGRYFSVQVNQTGYSPFFQQVQVGSSPTLSISLLALSSQTNSTNAPTSTTQLTVLDSSTGLPISGANVVYRDSVLGVQQTTTAQDGTAQLQMSGSSVTVFVSAANYQSSAPTTVENGIPKTISLNAQASLSGSQSCLGSNCPSQLSNVTVSITDSNGNPIDGNVQLFLTTSQGPILSAQSSGGVASFPNSVSVGSVIYAIVYLNNSNFVSPVKSDSVQVQGSQTNLAITASLQSANTNSNSLTATVLDDSKNPVLGATVYLYGPGNNNVLATNTTGPDGTVTFAVTNGQVVTLTAYLPGLVPSLPITVISGVTSATLVLDNPTLGNSVNVTVSVLDVDNVTPVSGATVTLFYAQSNVPVAFPAQITDNTGNAYFSYVPLGSSYYAQATNGANNGTSTTFVPSASSENNLTVVLARPPATLNVLASDPITGVPIVGGLVEVNDSNGNPQGSCQTNSSGGCSLTTTSQIPLQITFSANGYATTTVGSISLNPLTTNTFNLTSQLIPSSLQSSNELKVSVYSSNCLTPVTSPVLEKGQSYCILANYNVPTNQTNPDGFVLRLGSDGSVNSDPAFLTYLPNFADLNLQLSQLSVTRSDNYQNESGFNCTNSIASTTNSNSKWAQYEFSNTRGDFVVPIRFLVSSDATSSQSVSINYFAYAVHNGSYYRVPNDANLGLSYSNSQEDYCQALTNSTSFGITDGNYTYSNNGGAEVSFGNLANNLTNSNAVVSVGNNFTVNVNFRLYNAPNSPAVQIYTTNPNGVPENYVQILNYSSPSIAAGSASLGGTSNEVANLQSSLIPQIGGVWQSNLTFYVHSVQAVSSGDFVVQLLDGQNSIVNVTSNLAITGSGNVTLSTSSPSISTSTQSLVTITETTPEGVPITDGTIEVYSLSGNVFGPNYINGQIKLIGDNSSGDGLNGQYTFNNLNALRPGIFEFITGGPIDNRFASSSVTVSATNNNFISVFPSAVSLSCSSTQLQLTNSLSFTDAVVNFSFSDNNCASVVGTGVTCINSNSNYCNEFQLDIPAQTTSNVYLNPIRSTSCNLVINSSIGPSAVSITQIPTSVSCSNIAPTCSIGINPLSIVGGSSSTNSSIITVAFTNLPLENGMVAAYSCGQSGTYDTYQSILPAGSSTSTSSISTGTCQYSATSTPFQYSPSVTVLSQYNQTIYSCVSNNSVTVFPSGVSGSTCQLNYQSQPQSNVAVLSASFFNLPSTVSQAYFQCTPDSVPQSVPIIVTNGIATATYSCDYSNLGGLVFNATSQAGLAFCSNSSVSITPQGGTCSNGNETVAFGQCSTYTPFLRCSGADSTNPALTVDPLCCPSELGSNYIYSSNPQGCVQTSTNNLNVCNDGVTSPNSCRVQPTTLGNVPSPYFCPAGSSSNSSLVQNSTCCFTQPGFAYQSSTNSCVPLSSSQTNSCVVTANNGEFNQTIPYNSCAQGYLGYICSGNPDSPVLTGTSTCCPSGTSWCSNLNECASSCTPTTNSCSSNTLVGQCLQSPKNLPSGYSFEPSPYSCSANGNLSASFVANPACCTLSTAHSYQISDNGNFCVQVPQFLVNPTCTINLQSVSSSTDNSSVNAQLQISANGLDYYLGSQATLQTTCDSGTQTPATSVLYVSANNNSLNTPLNCIYSRSLYDYSVLPSATITLNSNSGQKAVTCSLNNSLLINGLSSSQTQFQTSVYVSNIQLAENNSPSTYQTTPPFSGYPLGPLNGVFLQVSLPALPNGLQDSDLQFYALCDSSNYNSNPSLMTLSTAQPHTWNYMCSYSSPISSAFWPVVHQPRAFYRVFINNTYYPANSMLGVPVQFVSIPEYAQPISTSLTENTLSLPSITNQLLVANLVANYQNIPTFQSNTQFFCSAGNVSTQIPVNSINSTYSSASATCSYQSSATASSVYPFNQLVSSGPQQQGQIRITSISSSLPIDYSAALPNATCSWVGLPTVLTASTNNNNFYPSVTISNINSIPSEVDFNCGNGQIVKALGSNIVQTSSNGQSIIVLATSPTACSYDFSSLTQNGNSIQTAPIYVSVLVDGQTCSNSNNQITLNTPSFGSMQSIMSVSGIDPLNQSDLVTITINNAISQLNQINPTANVVCGAGSSTTLSIPLSNTGTSTYSGSGTCIYSPVNSNTNRLVTATISSTQGVLPAPAPVTFIEYPQPNSQSVTNTNTLSTCNYGTILPLLLSNQYSINGGANYLNSAYSQAQEDAIIRQLITNHKYFVIGPVSNGAGFVGSGINNLQVTVTPLFPVANSLPILIYNGITTQSQTVQLTLDPQSQSKYSCYQITPDSLNLPPSASPSALPLPIQINYIGGISPNCLGQAVFDLQSVGQEQIPLQITVNAKLGYSSGYDQPQLNPSSNSITSLRALTSTTYQTPVVVSNNFPQVFQSSISLNSGASPSLDSLQISSGQNAYSVYTITSDANNKFTLISSGSAILNNPSYSLQSTNLPNPIINLSTFQPVGSIVSTNTPISSTSCSNGNYCNPAQINSVVSQISNSLNKEYSSYLDGTTSISISNPSLFGQTGSVNSCVNSMTSQFPNYNPSSAGIPSYCNNFDTSLVSNSQALGQQLSSNSQLSFLLMQSGFGSLGQNQQNSCSNMFGCMMIMQQALSDCSQLPGGISPTILTSIICTSSQIQNGNSLGGELAIVPLIQRYCKPYGTQNGFNSGTIFSPVNSESQAFLSSSAQNSLVQIPVNMLISTNSSSSKTLNFGITNGKYALQSITSSSGSSNGYPYIDCSSGSCLLSSDNGIANILTYSKYHQGSIQGTSCTFDWSSANPSSLVSSSSSYSFCNAQISTVEQLLSTNKACTSGNACIILHTDNEGKLWQYLIAAAYSDSISDIVNGTSIIITNSTPIPINSIADDLMSYVSSQSYVPNLINLIPSPCLFSFTNANTVSLSCPSTNAAPSSFSQVSTSATQPSSPNSVPPSFILQSANSGINMSIPSTVQAYHAIKLSIYAYQKYSQLMLLNSVNNNQITSVLTLCSSFLSGPFNVSNCNSISLNQGNNTLYIDFIPLSTVSSNVSLSIALSPFTSSSSYSSLPPYLLASSSFSLQTQSNTPSFTINSTTYSTNSPQFSLGQISSSTSSPYLGVVKVYNSTSNLLGKYSFLDYTSGNLISSLIAQLSSISPQLSTLTFKDQLGGQIIVNYVKGQANACSSLLYSESTYEEDFSNLLLVASPTSVLKNTLNLTANYPEYVSIKDISTNVFLNSSVNSPIKGVSLQPKQFLITSVFNPSDYYIIFVRPTLCSSGNFADSYFQGLPTQAIPGYNVYQA